MFRKKEWRKGKPRKIASHTGKCLAQANQIFVQKNQDLTDEKGIISFY
jgi:hypothetical protein